jgi:hypothetical protein
MATFLLIHSPLVGTQTWSLVADELRRMGHQALVPSLFAAPDPALPYWQQHANSVAGQRLTEPPILVGHSGAGPLLPALAQALHCKIAGYVFADCDLPRDGASRFDLFESAEEVAQFREMAVDGILPILWTADDLRQAIPKRAVRERFVADLHPLPLAVYEEALPVFAGFPDAPCTYLHFSPAYDTPARFAQVRGWLYLRLDGGHFEPLVTPTQVASLLDFAARAL